MLFKEFSKNPSKSFLF